MENKKVYAMKFSKIYPLLIQKAERKNMALIKGKICGISIESIEEPLMRKIRCLDKMIDELAKGKSMDKILNRQ